MSSQSDRDGFVAHLDRIGEAHFDLGEVVEGTGEVIYR